MPLAAAHPSCITDRPPGPQTHWNIHAQSKGAEPRSHSRVSLCNRRLQMLWGRCLSFPARSVCECVWAVVYIGTLMPILLHSLARAAGQNPNKRLLWCLRRLPVQNTVVLQRPMERRDGSALNEPGGERMAFIKLLRGPTWLQVSKPPQKWSIDLKVLLKL